MSNEHGLRSDRTLVMEEGRRRYYNAMPVFHQVAVLTILKDHLYNTVDKM